jgi:hypothetical protein
MRWQWRTPAEYYRRAYRTTRRYKQLGSISWPLVRTAERVAILCLQTLVCGIVRTEHGCRRVGTMASEASPPARPVCPGLHNGSLSRQCALAQKSQLLLSFLQSEPLTVIPPTSLPTPPSALSVSICGLNGELLIIWPDRGTVTLCLKGSWEATRSFSQYTRCPCWDSNWRPPDCECRPFLGLLY